MPEKKTVERAKAAPRRRPAAGKTRLYRRLETAPALPVDFPASFGLTQ
jgi:hypothetical protein